MSEDFNFSEQQPNYAEDGKETLKLIKNSRGYNWEIKLKSDLLSDDDLKRLAELNNKMERDYGATA